MEASVAIAWPCASAVQRAECESGVNQSASDIRGMRCERIVQVSAGEVSNHQVRLYGGPAKRRVAVRGLPSSLLSWLRVTV